MATCFVLSYWDLTEAASGGARRIQALLDSLGGAAVLIQPRRHHPQVPTVPYPVDFGRTKIGINWGMFNFRWPGTRQIAGAAIANHRPALLLMTSIWAAPIAARFPDTPSVLDAHDVNALAIAERFGDRHPFTRLVRRQEAAAIRLARHVFCCSERDRQAFIDLYRVEPTRISVVPNGVEVSAFPEAGATGPADDFWRKHCGDRTVLLFMGKLDYQPNQAALKFLGEDLMPELERRAPGQFRLLVTGGPAPAPPHPPGTVFAGRLPTERLHDYLLRADLCLAPVFTGGGTRLKVLEYMAAGKAVVSTPKGAEGIACSDGTHLAITDPEAFADRILSLRDNPAHAQALGQAARTLVRDHYDWTHAAHPRWQRVLDQYLHPTAYWQQAECPGSEAQ